MAQVAPFGVPDNATVLPTISDSAPEKANAGGDSPHSAKRFARETSSGAVADISTWDDQAVWAGLRAECSDFRALDANYPGRYHRLGVYIVESTKRFGEDAVRQELGAEGISKTRASYAERIAELYTFEQAAQFASVRAIVKTLPPKQPRRPKMPQPKLNGGSDHQAAEPQDPLKVPPEPPTNETILDTFVELGINADFRGGNSINIFALPDLVFLEEIELFTLRLLIDLPAGTAFSPRLYCGGGNDGLVHG
jgi:hypothetical protein